MENLDVNALGDQLIQECGPILNYGVGPDGAEYFVFMDVNYKVKDGNAEAISSMDPEMNSVKWNWRVGQRPKEDDILAHHGIMGQKWGVRNGPPYPLSRQEGHSAREKLYMGKGSVKRQQNTVRPASISKENGDVQTEEKKGLSKGAKVAIILGVATITAVSAYAIIKARQRAKENGEGTGPDIDVSKIFETDDLTGDAQPQGYETLVKEGYNTMTGTLDDVKEIVGEHTDVEDLLKVNANGSVYQKGRGMNCTMCATAYCARRNGLDVVAGSSFTGLNKDELQLMYGQEFKTIAGVAVPLQRTWDDAKYTKEVGKYMAGCMNAKQLDAQTLTSWCNKLAATKKPGQCGMACVKLANGGTHALAWEIDADGVAKIIDGQSANTFDTKTGFNAYGQVSSNLWLSNITDYTFEVMDFDKSTFNSEYASKISAMWEAGSTSTDSQEILDQLSLDRQRNQERAKRLREAGARHSALKRQLEGWIVG